MKEKFVRILALGGALCMPVGIQAAAGSAAIQNLQFQLIDLAPDDGVAASLVWDTALASADVSSAFGTTLNFFPDGTWSASFADTGSDSLFDPSSFSSAATASFAGVSASIVDGGFASRFQTHSSGSFDNALLIAYGAFTLSPMSQLRISGSLSVAIDGPAGTSFTVPPGTPADHAVLHARSFAYAEVGLNPLSASTSAPSFEAIALGGENFTTSTDPGLVVDAYSGSISHSPFSFELVNNTASTATGEFFARTVATGEQIVSDERTPSIPEPQIWMSLCAGLAVFAAWRLRRLSQR